MVSYPLSFEAILVDAIGLLLILLFVSILAVVALPSDHKNDARFESGGEPKVASAIRRSTKVAPEIERNFDTS